ncbi:hypothetical protein AB0C14_30000 [Microbispora hainanensis]|uniref:hypothetical protein n=1 Tax=Microbispora hainanensis TaxID=568844 RepID=UPI0033F04F65
MRKRTTAGAQSPPRTEGPPGTLRSLPGRSAGIAGSLALDGPAEELAFRLAHQAAPLLPRPYAVRCERQQVGAPVRGATSTLDASLFEAVDDRDDGGPVDAEAPAASKRFSSPSPSSPHSASW